MTRLYGFPPLVGVAPRALVLGSMPSVASLEKQQYYGKPQNSFWRIMGELYGAGPDLEYAARTARLASSGVAVWDVVAECVRPGSLDSAIDMSSLAVNDFPAFLGTHDQVSHVFFNGRKAEEIFRRHALADVMQLRPQIQYNTLPSTSPAMATLDFDGKLQRWQVVLQVTAGRGQSG